MQTVSHDDDCAMTLRQPEADLETASSSGVVVNFDLGERVPRPRSQQLGSLRLRARRVAVLGVEPVDAGGGRPLPLREFGGVTPEKFLRFLMPNPALGGNLGQKKLSESQSNEYDVICRNASVLAFHLWPTIFDGAPFRLQNICRNGVPPRSRTTTPLASSLSLYEKD